MENVKRVFLRQHNNGKCEKSILRQHDDIIILISMENLTGNKCIYYQVTHWRYLNCSFLISEAEFKATRILECLGIMFGTGSTVLLFLYTCLQQSTVVEAVAAFHALVASILIPIGVKLYIDDKSPNGELGYSVAVTSVGGKLYMITFLCLLCDMYWKSSWRKTNSFCTRISKWTQIFIKRISHR
ncbi:hypothetical protein SNE40_009022 [Patella caerulea]|uniref:Uncharacterized protein n=1 Tax=Patella caerulea TaxID=87958 RepID=A0AAN8JSN3_PATCE